MARKTKKMHQGLPVAGYTPQPSINIVAVNNNKDLEELVLRRVENLRDTHDLDGRWAAIALTHFEQGFMALNRAVFRPARISGEIGYGPIKTGGAQEPPTAAD